MTDFSASTSEFTGSDLLDSTSAFDVESFDGVFKSISAVESRWRLPALPDEVKLDLASMPGVTPESVTSLLSGLDRDINGEDEPSEPDPAINYKTSLLDPSWGRNGFDQFRVIAAGIAQRPAPTDPTVDAVKLFKQKAIKGGYLEVPDGTELDNIWSPELNSVRFKMAQDDYDKQMRGNRFGAVPVTGENGLIKQLDKWTSPGGLLAAATELDLFWDGGAISKEFSTWGDKWRKVGKSKNPWDFATNLVDAVTGPIDDIVFPVVNWALIGTGVGGIANAGKVGWLASRAGNGSKVWDTLYGASKILNPLEKSNISELGRKSWTATKLAGSGNKTLQGLGRGMEAWRGYAPVKATKSALQVPMRMGIISQAEDLFPGYGGQGASIGSVPGVSGAADFLRSTTTNPAFLPAEVLLAPYNIFTPGTFLRSAGEGANLASRVGDLARRAGTAPGRATVGAATGAVVGAVAGDDAGDIAQSAGLGALAGLALPAVGRALASPSGRVIGSSALGALAGTGLAAVSDDDLSNGLMLGAVSGLGLVGANSIWSKVPNPGRWTGHIGTAMSMLNLKPLTDDQRVTAAFDRGLRAALNADELAAYDREVKNTGSVLKGIAKLNGTDDEGARHVLSWYLVNGAIDNTARVQAGKEGKGFYERFYMHRHKLTSQLRTFNLDDLSSQTLDDIARAMVVDQASTYHQFKTLWRRKRTEIAKDPQKALTFAKSHNENAALTLKQLLSTENLGLEDAADLPFDPAIQPTNLVPDWNKLEPEKKLGAFEAYVAGTRNTPFGQWDEFYASTEGLQRAMVSGWLDDARFKSARNFWGQEMGPGVELGENTKQIQEHTAAIKEALFRMPAQDAAKAMKGNRFSPLASMATAGRFTVGRQGNPWKQDILSLADEVGHYLQTKSLMKSLGSAEDITTPLGMIARAAETEGLGTLDDLTDSSWKHLIKLTGTKSKRHKIDQLRKFATHKGMSMRDVETRLESAMDELAHDDRIVAALGAGNDYVRGEDGAALRGSQALMQRRKQLNEKARYTAAEVDTAALRGQNPELDEMLDGLESRGYTLVHGVEFLSPHDLANSNALGFADMGTRELNYQTFGNFFRGKLPAIRRIEEERRYRTAIAHELSLLDDAELGDITVDSKAVSDALEDLTKHVLQPLEDDHLRRVEDLHTLGWAERQVKRTEIAVGQFTVPRRPEDLMQSPERVLHTLTARGWTQAQAEAIAKAIPKMRNTTFADLGLYSFEAKFRQRNELVQALKFLGGSKQSHLLQIAGGTLGAAAGAAQDPDAGLLERLGQGAIGAAVGAGVGTAARGGMRQSLGRSKTLATWEDRAALKSAGYLGDKLVRLRDNLRFGLSPFFDISRYCLAPDTKVLTGDLRWVPVGELEVGDHVAGFDEEQPGEKHAYRKWRNAYVTGTGRDWLPSYRVTLADGSELVCSEQHKWLMVNKAGTNKRWITTEELFDAQSAPSRDPETGRYNLTLDTMDAIRLLDTWEQDDSREAGYLAGMFDGEGSLSTPGMRISLAQRQNAALRSVESALADRGFGFSTTLDSGGKHKDVACVYVKGGLSEHARFLGQVRPVRLLDVFQRQGGIERFNRLTIKDRVRVTSVEFLGLQEVVTLGTSTKTIVAEGFAHHNTEGMMLAQTAAPLRNAKGERIALPLNASPRGLRNRIAKELKAENPGISSYQLKKESHAKFSELQAEFAAAAHGDYDPDILESTRKWFSEVGIMGFNPADWMATAYKNLRLSGVDDPETAYKAAREMYTYGTRGRSAAELSVNFIFFPFSFQKKALGHIGKWMNDDLARSLIIHDAFKTYEILDEKYKLDDYWREHMPVLDQLNKLNLLAFGLSPGRFGGINSELFGAAYRGSMAMFMPWAGSVKSPAEAAELQRVVRQLLPAMNDINWMMKGVKENGYKGYFTPFEQTRAAKISDGWDEWNAYKAELDQHLQSMGASWGELFGSPLLSNLKAQYDNKKAELGAKYPEWQESKREYVSNLTVLGMEKDDKIASLSQYPPLLAALNVRDMGEIQRILVGLPQNLKDAFELAWFETQVAWLQDRMNTLGISVGGEDGWTDAPSESIDWLRARSQELRQIDEHWHGTYVKYFAKTFGPDEGLI